MPPVHKYHPQTTPQEVVDKILAASADHPRWGCVKLSDWLKLQGGSVSSPTTQNILTKHNLGSRYERLLKLEECHLTEGVVLLRNRLLRSNKPTPASVNAMWSHPNPANNLVQFKSSITTSPTARHEGKLDILYDDGKIQIEFN